MKIPTPLTDADIPAPSASLRSILRDALDESCGEVLDEHLEHVTDEVLAHMAKALGGFVIDPQVIGLNDGVTVRMDDTDRVPGREVYLSVDLPDGSNLLTFGDPTGVVHDPTNPEYRPGWVVVG